MVDERTIARRFTLIEGHLDERLRRLVAAAEAKAVGVGGVSMVARATGVSRRVIRAGMKELTARPAPPGSRPRIRRPGGGRKRTVDTDPTLRKNLERLIEPTSRGDPESPLQWTCKSVRRLAAELKRQGHTTSHRMVADLLHELDYSLQGNAKTLEGASHPDRNAQFELSFANTPSGGQAGGEGQREQAVAATLARRALQLAMAIVPPRQSMASSENSAKTRALSQPGDLH